MNKEEHPNIKNEDWRLQAISTLAKPFKSPWTGKVHPIGEPVKAISIVKYGSNKISFGLPNTTAMFLNKSYKFWKEADSILKNIQFINSRHIKNETDVFNFFENIMASIVFAYTSLESFANEKILEDHIYTQERADKRCAETYSKEQIERFLSLDIKLDKILPEILGISSPKKKRLWNKYIELKNLRDRIIHMKSIDRKSSDPKKEIPDSIWRYLLKKDIPNMSASAKEIISYYFSKEKEAPRWFKKCPF